MSDPLLDLIRQLPPAEVEPGRARQVQERCHNVLRRRTRSGGQRQAARFPAWSRVTLGLAALYLTEALRRLLAMYGVR